MKKGKILIYTGEGRGKSPAALGRAVLAAAQGESVIIIQFLKGKGLGDSDFVKSLEPAIRLFRFEKSDCDFRDLSPEKQEEEVRNIQNGIHYARKVMNTGECNLLILDEVLGLLDTGILKAEELQELLASRDEEMDVIMTGITLNEKICNIVDEIDRIEQIK